MGNPYYPVNITDANVSSSYFDNFRALIWSEMQIGVDLDAAARDGSGMTD